MRKLQCLFTLVLLLAFASIGRAQSSGTIAWDSGYPKTGSSSGEISIKGTITLDAGSSAAGTTVTVRAWIGGCDEYTTQISIMPCGSTYTFSGAITGLTSCSNYNVTVDFNVSNSCVLTNIKTEPLKATAK